ncbi:hypothetical protein TSUD_29980 [Trifolium subterraneum]|uniref:Uncharacterized protein n=1 Tax=Trifolium subterraneum TaxID=3900 RepID=A0A2Z6M645_TRISU|nr:hypothetical protein TSUD_29980 [Trifolium subterraneum]
MIGTELATWGILIGSVSKEVEQAGSTIEFGKEEGGIALRFRGLDPLKTRLDDAIFTATFAKYTTSIATQSHGRYKIYEGMR